MVVTGATVFEQSRHNSAAVGALGLPDQVGGRAPGPGLAVSVSLLAADPVLRAGVAAQLAGDERITLLEEAVGFGEVALVVVDTVGDEATAVVGAATEAGAMAVIVATTFRDAPLGQLVEAGARGLLRRSDATADRLSDTIVATAKGEAAVPVDLLGRLLREVSAGRGWGDVRWPRKLAVTDREVKVLGLVADGLDTSEIAAQLFYSERTVKNVIHDVVARHQLRNRTHAVAHAIRQGWI